MPPRFLVLYVECRMLPWNLSALEKVWLLRRDQDLTNYLSIRIRSGFWSSQCDRLKRNPVESIIVDILSWYDYRLFRRLG
jgi:hypothetical protein